MSGLGVSHCPTCAVQCATGETACWSCGQEAARGYLPSNIRNGSVYPDSRRTNLAGEAALIEFTARCEVCGHDALWRWVVIATGPDVRAYDNHCPRCHDCCDCPRCFVDRQAWTYAAQVARYRRKEAA